MCEIETCYVYFMHEPNILRVSDDEVSDNEDITEEPRKVHQTIGIIRNWNRNHSSKQKESFSMNYLQLRITYKPTNENTTD